MNIPGLFQEIGDDFLVKAKELFDMHTRLYEQTDGTVSPLLPNERILGLLDNLDRKLKNPHRTVTTLPPQVFCAYVSQKIVIYTGLCSYASAFNFSLLKILETKTKRARLSQITFLKFLRLCHSSIPIPRVSPPKDPIVRANNQLLACLKLQLHFNFLLLFSKLTPLRFFSLIVG